MHMACVWYYCVVCHQGKVVTIQIEDMQMKWISPESTTPLCVQPIGKIRVWGIGLENERGGPPPPPGESLLSRVCPTPSICAFL